MPSDWVIIAMGDVKDINARDRIVAGNFTKKHEGSRSSLIFLFQSSQCGAHRFYLGVQFQGIVSHFATPAGLFVAAEGSAASKML